jgi:hypothetical protein
MDILCGFTSYLAECLILHAYFVIGVRTLLHAGSVIFCISFLFFVFFTVEQ